MNIPDPLGNFHGMFLLFKSIELPSQALDQWSSLAGRYTLKSDETWLKSGQIEVQRGQWVKTGEKKIKWV